MTARRAPQRELSLLDLLAVLRRRLGLLLVVLLVGCGLSAALLSLVPRTYLARTLILIDPDRGRPGDPSGLAGGALDTAMIDSQVQILASRSLARDIIINLKLIDDPELAAPLPSPGSVLRGVWERLAGAPVADAETDPLETGEDPIGEAVDRFLERLAVAREGKTYAIAVSFKAADPDKAARIANAVAEHYLLAQLASKVDSAQRTAAWLAERLAAAKAQHEADLAALTAFRAANELAVGGGRAGHEGERLVHLERELIAASLERTTKEARIARLKELVRRGEPLLPGEELGSSTLLQNLNALKAQSLRREAELKAEFGDRHPRIIDARREIAELEARIEAEQTALLREQEAALAAARTREQALARELDRVKARAAETDRAGQELRTLEQRAEISRRLYESYLGQVERSALSEADQRPDARVISEAVPPTSPSFPRPKTVLGVALTVSLVVASLAVYLAELADRGFRTASDVRETLGLTPLALLPQTSARAGGPPEAHVLDRPAGRLAEGVRAVLASLLALPTASRGRVVLVTSCVPGEGKTTLAMCLGRLAAAEGLKTLLVDADLRRPRVRELLGPEPRPGLGELLRGECTLESVLKVDALSGLIVLPGSARAAQPTRLLGADGLGKLLAAARERFDLVIVDTAPLGAVADPRLIARLVDHALLVVRWHATARELAAATLAGARELEGKLVGAVLNRVDLRREARYGRSGDRATRRALACYYGD